jgi:hypothetical protein
MDWNEFTQRLNDKMDKTFKPNTQWMAEKYTEMNAQLFNGELGDCNFNIFTTGRGSQGGTLGWFKIMGRNIRVDRYSRRMFVNGWDRIYINRENFVQLCRPTIELNGNYSGTEHGFLATLVHEMCHYYTYMNGYAPKQGHGAEFKRIGYEVSQRSKGMFTIQRLATAEEMRELELSDEMKAKRANRLANKKASVSAIVVFTPEGKVKLTITSNQNLMNMISTSEKERGNDVKISNDSEVIEFLFSKGYKKNMRSWRYWSLEDKPWVGELKNMLDGTPQEEPKKQEVQLSVHNHRPKRIFTIKTSNGVFEYDASSYYSLLKAIKEKFPNMNDEVIQKIMNNPNNYRMEENKMNIKTIVESVIEEFMQNEFRGANNMDDSVEITPEMNLGEFSPLEIA